MSETKRLIALALDWLGREHADPGTVGTGQGYATLAVAQALVELKPAEPRWPSGPDAERELAAALNAALTQRGASFSGPIDDFPWGSEAEAVASLTLAALQEKRDPGE